jgi:hypothetical protein
VASLWHGVRWVVTAYYSYLDSKAVDDFARKSLFETASKINPNPDEAGTALVGHSQPPMLTIRRFLRLAMACVGIIPLGCFQQPPREAAPAEAKVTSKEPSKSDLRILDLRVKIANWEQMLPKLTALAEQFERDRTNLLGRIDALSSSENAQLDNQPQLVVLSNELREIDQQQKVVLRKRRDYETAILTCESAVRSIERRSAAEGAGLAESELTELSRTMIELEESLSNPSRTVSDVSNALDDGLSKQLAEYRKRKSEGGFGSPPQSFTPRKVTTRPLDELNTDGDERGPWLSPDGLRIYWWRRPTLETTESEIWTAVRTSFDAPFAGKRRVSAGEGFALTGDQLEMILLPGRDKDLALHIAKRSSTDSPFEPPELLKEFDNLRLDSPCLSTDGLFLVLEVRSGSNAADFLYSSRPDRQSRWEAPRPLPLSPGPYRGKRLRSPFLSADSRSLWGSVIENRLSASGASILIWKRNSPLDSFAEPTRVVADAFEGDVAYPHPCPISGEMFFVRFPKPGDLYVTAIP